MNGADGWVSIKVDLETKNFDAEIKKVQQELKGLQAKESELIFLNKKRDEARGKAFQVTNKEYQIMQKLGITMDEIGNKKAFQKLQTEIQKTNNKLIDLNKKQREIDKTNYSNIKESLSSIGNGTEKVIKKITRWGLAIFGIRSAYMLIRQAMSTLSQYDEQMATNIEYIRYLLATTLKPVIETIINLVYTLLTYINYITQAWFGINLFANASTKEFQKQNKALGSSVKNAKELKNQLAGFDEANILSDNTSSQGGSGGGGQTKLPKFNEVKIPKWLEWIAKNKNTILAVFSGIVAGLIGMKLGLEGIQALGFGVAIAGIVYAIEKIIDFIKDPSFENFTGILEGIAIAVIGIGIAFGNLPLVIAGAIAFIVIEIVKNFDKIKGLFNSAIEWLDKNFLGALNNIFGPIGHLIYMPFETAIKMIKSMFENVFGGIKKIVEGIVMIFKGDFKEGITNILSGFGDILLAPFRALKDGAKTIIDRVIGFFKDAISWVKKLIGYEDISIEKANAINYKTGGGGFSSGGGGKGAYGGGSSGSRAKGGIFYPSKLPKLAVGGIINNPGMGVAYNGAIIGERGAEAVVPLTDSQQMSLLGETIGRYITVNATIINQMNGRVISKELQQIRSQEDFQFNG